jgi:NAD-dependent dihydropyrimidine dehydrogenase PreA subunit
MFEIKNIYSPLFDIIMTEAKQNIVNRKIIKIDEDLCTGCGNCVITCAEAALEIIDGKAKVVNDIFCDGLGACLGECPEGALEIVEREAVEFDEEAVEKRLESLKEKEEEKPVVRQESGNVGCGCAGSHAMSFEVCDDGEEQTLTGEVKSQLRQWPIQMHLISPTAPYFQGADVLLSADCVAHSLGGFHPEYLKGKSVGIACPKLDQGLDSYVEKIRAWIDDAKINTLTVLTMQVPCCSGLVRLAMQGAANASRKVPIKSIVVSLQGEILREEWL